MAGFHKDTKMGLVAKLQLSGDQDFNKRTIIDELTAAGFNSDQLLGVGDFSSISRPKLCHSSNFIVDDTGTKLVSLNESRVAVYREVDYYSIAGVISGDQLRLLRGIANKEKVLTRDLDSPLLAGDEDREVEVLTKEIAGGGMGVVLYDFLLRVRTDDAICEIRRLFCEALPDSSETP